MERKVTVGASQAVTRRGPLWMYEIDCYGGVFCGRCGSRTLASVDGCEVCEEDEEQDRASMCVRKEEIYLLPFVSREPETGLIFVCTERANKMDDAFNAIIQHFEKYLRRICLKTPNQTPQTLRRRYRV